MEPIESDSTNSGLVNGLTDDNDGIIPSGGMGGVKRNKKSGQLRSSASSQGSSVRGELTLARESSETSTASTSSDEEERRKIVKRRKKKTRKHHHSVIHHQPHDEDDDERTDSAEEQQEDDSEQRSGRNRFIRGPRANRGYHSNTSSGGGMTFDSTSTMLKPLSPTMLSVGYGAELMIAHPHVQAADYSNVTSLMNSPHQSEGHASSVGGGIGGAGLSPEQTDGISRGSVSANIIEHDNSVISLIPTTLAPSLSSTVSALVGSNTVGTTPAAVPIVGAAPTATNGSSNSNGSGTGAVLNPSSSTISAAANALPFAGWWGPTAPIYSPFCGPSGSVATTPVGGTTDGTGLLRPGSSVNLRAVICQESDGVLTVNVQWRNKSYSGSLIDVSQHQWAPPRLMEGFQDLPIRLKDFYQKQELEKEPVDVVIDEDKEDDIIEESESTQRDDQQQSSETGDANKIPTTTVIGGETYEEKPTQGSSENITTDHSPSTSATTTILPPPPPPSSSTSTATTTNSSSKLDMLMKPPNGFKSSSITEKLKPPTLPAFDAVKSPQPQIGRDDLSSDKKKDSEGGATVIIPDTHRNLNTLVDVAAKMKPVLNDTSPTNKSSKTIGNGSKGFTENNEKSVDNISQHQLKDANKATQKEDRPVVKHHPDEPLPPNVLPFSSEGSNSPDKQSNDLKEDKNTVSKKGGSSFLPPIGSKQVTSHSWHPPASMQENTKDKRGSPTTNMPPGILSKPPRTVGEHHLPPPQMPPLPFHPSLPPPPSSSTVIQKKRKRVSPQTNEMSKRPSPPIKERDSSPLSGPPPSLFGNTTRPFDHPSILHGGSIPPDKHLLKSMEQVGPQPPPGFMYDPSLPMSYDLQVVSYTREKQAEANRNPDRSTPPTKPQKRQHPPFDMHTSGDPSSSSRSPPYFASNLPGNSAKRSSSSNNSTSGSNSNKISPGVVMQTSDATATRHPSMIQQSPIKQEVHHPSANRPARPSSKGTGVSMPPHVSMGKSSSRKGNPSRRMDNPPSVGGPIIKQEPLDHTAPHQHHILSGAPGAHLPYGQLHQAAFVLSSSPGMPPTVVQQPAQFTQSQQWGGVISNSSSSSSSSSQAHKRTPSDILSIPPRGSNATRTPSPAPSKKSNEWQTTHPSVPPPHQQLIKHDSVSQRHSSVSGDKHNSVSTHGSSSSSSNRHHGGSSNSSSSKHDMSSSSSSSRHVIAAPQSHPAIQIPPPAAAIPTGAAAAQALSPNSYIADLRNGVPVEWMKQHMHLMQLDALKQGGIVGPAPPIQAQVHPQELAIWQNQMAQLAAMQQQQQQLPVDQATMMQLAIQQQQQQQQNEAVTQAFAAQGLFPLQFPTAQVLPFPLSQPPAKRDT